MEPLRNIMLAAQYVKIYSKSNFWRRGMRLEQCIRQLREEGHLPYLISSLKNIKYLTGFAGSYGYLLLADDKTFFISDSRYEEYAQSILPSGVTFILQQKDIYTEIKKLCAASPVQKLFLEEHSVPLSSYFELARELSGIELLPGGDVVNRLRIVKDESEIELLRRAAQLTDECVTHLVNTIRLGITEWDIAVEIEYFYRTRGAAGTSFETIVASGAGSSMPHYKTSMTKKIEHGDAILIDMGCMLDGYNSDITRTFFMGEVPQGLDDVYSIVYQAQAAGVKAVCAGALCGDVDLAARSVIAAAGFGERFGHSTGHGVGLDVHEFPAVKKDGAAVLEPGSVITVEPGIYIPGEGGVRIEDMVLVARGGCEVLTHSSRELLVL